MEKRELPKSQWDYWMLPRCSCLISYKGFVDDKSPCGSFAQFLREQCVGLMASNRKQIQEDTQLRVLRMVQENPQFSTRDIAYALGISNGSAYYCLNALVEKGLVKLGNFSASQHKNRYAYNLTPSGMSEKAPLTKRFLTRKRMEFDALKEEIDALEAEMSLELAPKSD